jgi:hypothetical protein
LLLEALSLTTQILDDRTRKVIMKESLSWCILPTLLITFCIPYPLFAAKSTTPNCLSYDRKIDTVKQKMRQGYTVTQGEYYKKKLADLQDDRVLCEKTIKLKLQHKKRQSWQKKQQNQQKQLAKIASQGKTNTQWSSSSPSKERLKQWELLQQQENEKFGRVKAKYQGVIVEDK